MCKPYILVTRIGIREKPLAAICQRLKNQGTAFGKPGATCNDIALLAIHGLRSKSSDVYGAKCTSAHRGTLAKQWVRRLLAAQRIGRIPAGAPSLRSSPSTAPAVAVTRHRHKRATPGDAIQQTSNDSLRNQERHNKPTGVGQKHGNRFMFRVILIHTILT